MYFSYSFPTASSQDQWWKHIDKILLSGFLFLCFIGTILVASSGAMIARRIGVNEGFFSSEWLFFAKYIGFAACSLLTMFAISRCSFVGIRRIGTILFLFSLILLALTPLFGTEIKGAKRWILGVQPSEFMKPGFVIFCAWMMSLAQERHHFYGRLYAFFALLLTISLLLLQPDFGQTILVVTVWMAMFFASGASLLWFVGLAGTGATALCGGYFLFSHVRKRIDAFLSPDAFDKFGVNYQSEIAKKAFAAGGLFGRGPGEGEVKQSLPDSHTDYIFSVAGEELGVLLCLLIISIYGGMVFYSLKKISTLNHHFSRFAVVGLMTLFGMQAFINMSVNVGLLPPKGMTLPFISYGGSSVLGLGFLAGFVLALSKQKETY